MAIVSFYPTLCKAVAELSDQRRSSTGSLSSFAGIEKLDLSQKAQIVLEMRNRKTGLNIHDRKYRLRTYKQSFIGSEAVSWMMERVDVPSREEAVRFLQELLEDNIIGHVGEKNEFIDGSFFYRLRSEEGDSQ